MLRRYLTEAEQQHLLKVVSGSNNLLDRRDAAWIAALLHSGMRITEFSLITVGDVKNALASKYLFIPRENRKGKSADHRVFLTQAFAADLRRLLDIRIEMTGDDTADLNAPLVVSRNHASMAPMTTRSYEMRFKKWAAAAGLPADASPHWLRHTRALNIMKNSKATDPRGVVQAALAHQSIASTGIYTQVLKEDMEAALSETDSIKPKRVSLAAMRKDFLKEKG